jgi:hypothetical protein
MKCDSWASFLAYTLVSPCLGHEPKAKVVTYGIKASREIQHKITIKGCRTEKVQVWGKLSLPSHPFLFMCGPSHLSNKVSEIWEGKTQNSKELRVSLIKIG